MRATRVLLTRVASGEGTREQRDPPSSPSPSLRSLGIVHGKCRRASAAMSRAPAHFPRVSHRKSFPLPRLAGKTNAPESATLLVSSVTHAIRILLHDYRRIDYIHVQPPAYNHIFGTHNLALSRTRAVLLKIDIFSDAFFFLPKKLLSCEEKVMQSNQNLQTDSRYFDILPRTSCENC